MLPRLILHNIQQCKSGTAQWKNFVLVSYCIAGKFGGELNLAVWRSDQTTKFKSANIFAMAILDPTAKFDSCQYFQLYGIVEQHKSYWMVLESWESIQGNQNVPFFIRGTFSSACE